MPVERCTTKTIPKETCPATHPKIVCERCKVIQEPIVLTDEQCQADQFDFPTVDITAACLW